MSILRLIVAFALLAQPLLATAGLRGTAAGPGAPVSSCCADLCHCADDCPCMSPAPADPRPASDQAPSPRPVEVRALLAPLPDAGGAVVPASTAPLPRPGSTTRPILSFDSLQAAFCIWTT